MANTKLKVGQTVSYDGEKYKVWSTDNNRILFVLKDYSNPKYELPLNKVKPLEELEEIINNNNKVRLLTD